MAESPSPIQFGTSRYDVKPGPRIFKCLETKYDPGGYFDVPTFQDGDYLLETNRGDYVVYGRGENYGAFPSIPHYSQALEEVSKSSDEYASVVLGIL